MLNASFRIMPNTARSGKGTSLRLRQPGKPDLDAWFVRSRIIGRLSG